eukprot:TRINITY_DN17265_c0_g2_i1.p1 TRINITY_DN17265_c0_g2~~TRINITY_DN17265_c0_g2_i1.p1  ORF type:complete len:299 (-),score=93.08 TRINITY_DN17265_c0_g2_i1:383-1186(-)
MASEVASISCKEWQQDALGGDERVFQHLETSSMIILDQAKETVRAHAGNLLLAQELLIRLHQDEDAKQAKLEGDLEDNKDRLQKLEVQLVAEEPDQDIDDVQSELARGINEQDSLKQRLEESKDTQRELELIKLRALQQWDSLCKLPQSLGQMVKAEEGGLRDAAQQSAAELYQKYPLWARPKGSSCKPGTPQDTAAKGSTALVALSPEIQEWIASMIEQMAEKKAEQKIQQLRADLLFRRPGAGARGSGSEAGDSWTEVSAAPENP